MYEEYVAKRLKCDVCGDKIQPEVPGYIHEIVPTYTCFKSRDDSIHLCSSCAIMVLEHYSRIVDEDTIETMKKKINYQRRDIEAV